MKQIAFFIMLVSYATVVSSSPDITFHGNLIAPPTCIVSENKTIEIAFNEVIIVTSLVITINEKCLIALNVTLRIPIQEYK